MTNMKPFRNQDGRYRSQHVGLPRPFSAFLFLLPLLFAHAADGDITAELLEAAKVGETVKVEQLIKQGADVNARNKNGTTALMDAAIEGHAETLKILIDASADVNATQEDGNTALTWAAQKGHTGIVNILKRAGAKE